jgi:hypothetical protein
VSRPRDRLSRYGWQPADPPQRPVLFVNPRSGGGAAARAGIAERARQSGVEVVTLTPGDDLAALVRAAVANGADALGAAGRDESLAVVAAEAAAHGLPFVCIPAGTRNHFALDLGVDRRDVSGALAAFTDGVERRIDVAAVNGRMSLNNVSLGDLRGCGRQDHVSRCQGAHTPGDRPGGAGAKRPGAGAAPSRRCRAGTG